MDTPEATTLPSSGFPGEQERTMVQRLKQTQQGSLQVFYFDDFDDFLKNYAWIYLYGKDNLI